MPETSISRVRDGLIASGISGENCGDLRSTGCDLRMDRVDGFGRAMDCSDDEWGDIGVSSCAIASGSTGLCDTNLRDVDDKKAREAEDGDGPVVPSVHTGPGVERASKSVAVPLPVELREGGKRDTLDAREEEREELAESTITNISSVSEKDSE